MKYKIIFCLALVLFIFPIKTVNAAPQSFFISPKQKITHGDTAKMYCLEVSKEILTKDNIKELTRIVGNVWVIYNDGRRILRTLSDLKEDQDIDIIARNSHEEIKFEFNESSNIIEIIIDDNGITLYRDQLDDYEEWLTRENRKKILDLIGKGITQKRIQDIIWRNHNPLPVTVDNLTTINFRTTDEPDKQIHTIFNNTSTVSYEKQEKPFLRVDGILNTTKIFNKDISELVTHFHNDHISRPVFKHITDNAYFSRIITPYPILNVSKNKTFDYFRRFENNNYIYKYRYAKTDMMQIISNIGLSIITDTMGNFDYTLYKYDDDITVEMFKYKNPKDANKDGIIYLITNKVVSFLMFGDFDDPEGIDNLLDVLIKNQLIKADVIKWSHHAHIFDEKYRNLIIKLNRVLDPYFIIYQPHSTQDLDKFKKFIDSFEFKEKFIDSSKNTIRIISQNLLFKKYNNNILFEQGEQT